MTEKLQKIKQTFDFGYCPVVFVCNKDSKKYAYLLNLWRQARDKTMIEYPEFTGHTWRIWDGDKKKLIFASDNYADANLFFWKQLEELSKERWAVIQSAFCELSSDEVGELNS